MKKILTLMVFLLMVSCGTSNNDKNSSSLSSSINKGSNPSSYLSSIDGSVSSSSSSDIFEDYDDGFFGDFENTVYNIYGRENLRSQMQIMATNDRLSIEQNIRMRRNADNSSSYEVSSSSSNSSSMSSSSISSISSTSKQSLEELYSKLSGQLRFEDYSAEVTSKMLNEPCSKAFMALQNLIYSGNGSYNFSGKTIKYGNFGGLIRINRFKEKQSLTLVRYGDYNVFINYDENNPYVLFINNYNYNGNIHYSINFACKNGMIYYDSISKSLSEELDIICSIFDNLDEYCDDGLAIKLYANIIEKEGNNKWQEKVDLDISDFEMRQLYFQRIEDLYFSRHSRLTGSEDYFEINEGKLEGITSLVTSFYLPIPDGITKIGVLKEKTKYYDISAVYIPSSVKELEKGAFEGLGVEMFFIDELRENLGEDYHEILRSSCPNARIYYKNNWDNYSGIIIPKEYYFSIYENNIDGVNIKEKVAILNKILSFSRIIPVEKYNEYLDIFNELIDNLTNNPEFINEIDSKLYAFYDEVLANTTSEYKYWFTKVEDGKEVKVETVTGEIFVKEDLKIVFDNNILYEQINIKFNTNSWPSIQLDEVFGENVIPNFTDSSIVFNSEYEGNYVVISCNNITSEIIEEYINILLASGFQRNDNNYWIRQGDKVVSINIYFQIDYLRISISTNENILPRPTTDVTLTYHKIEMYNWPSYEEYQYMYPYYDESLPLFYVENDLEFRVAFYEYSESGEIQCVFKENDEAITKFILEIEQLGFVETISHDEERRYFKKAYYTNDSQISHYVRIEIRLFNEYYTIRYYS